jgi:hypothetical protein
MQIFLVPFSSWFLFLLALVVLAFVLASDVVHADTDDCLCLADRSCDGDACSGDEVRYAEVGTTATHPR